MPDSLVSLRLPAVVWIASTALVVANHEGQVALGLVAPLVWLVFLGGVAYFLVGVWRHVTAPGVSRDRPGERS